MVPNPNTFRTRSMKCGRITMVPNPNTVRTRSMKCSRLTMVLNPNTVRTHWMAGLLSKHQTALIYVYNIEFCWSFFSLFQWIFIHLTTVSHFMYFYKPVTTLFILILLSLKSYCKIKRELSINNVDTQVCSIK